MIEYLRGSCRAIRPGSIVIDVNGVGYGVEMPLSTICELRPGQADLELWVCTHVREEAIRLFGFRSYEERCTFDLLLSVSGVGPRVAMAIMSTLNVAEIRQSLAGGRDGDLRGVPGVGPKLAERIVVELRQKVQKLSGFQATETSHLLALERPMSVRQGATIQEPVFADLRSALENLGFKPKDYDPILERLAQTEQERTLSGLMRRALVELGPHGNRLKSKE